MLLRIALTMTLAASVASAELVKISLQPAYWAIPMWAAKKYGWFEELGIEVEFSVFPSGAPQVKAAVDDKAWDVGIAGSVPNVIAGQQSIFTVGISNDESYTTEVVGAPGVTEWPPSVVTENIFAGTPKSTGELLLRKCLEAAPGLTFNDQHIMFDQQGEIMTKLVEDGDPQYACLWAPNTYTYREANPQAQVFCSGRDIDFPIFGGLMMRAEWAEANEELAKKVLAAYLRGVTFMQNAEMIDEVLVASTEWHEYSETTISQNAMREDLILRPLYNLDQQLDHLNRNFANEYTSSADRHYIALEDFLFDQGVIENKFEPKEYVLDTYMKLVSEDPKLRAFSYYGAAELDGAAPAESTPGLPELVKISLQPAYHAIPMWAAQKYGWFKDLGIEVEFSVFASGAPQVQAAVDDKAWDVGIAGSVPNVIAGSQNIMTVGISNDESYTTEVVGAPNVLQWPPVNMTDQIFAGTPKSTGELLLRKCLESVPGLEFDDKHILFDQQGEIMKKLIEDGDPQYACLWAPNTYSYREAHPTAQVFCSGRNIDFPIFGGLMFRAEWAEANTELAKKVLAAYLRGITFMQNAEMLDEVLVASDEYHRYSETTISQNAMKEDLILRPIYNLDQQLDHLNRNFANGDISDADRHYIALEEFLFDQGVTTTKGEPKEYVLDTYMKLVSEDPKLRAFSYYGAADFGSVAPPAVESTGSSASSKAGLIVGMVLVIVGALI